MNKILHKIRLSFLHPFWSLKRLSQIAGSKKVLDVVLKLEDEVKEYDLKVRREENKNEMLKAEGMKRIIFMLKERLSEVK